MTCTANYTRSLLVQISSDIEKVTSTFDMEEIHDLRVGIKRLRSLLLLLTRLDPEINAKENGLVFKSLFKKIGRIRDVQIPLQIVSNLNDQSDLNLKSVIKQLRREVKQRIKETIQWIQANPVNYKNEVEKINKLARQTPCSERRVKNYLKDLWSTMCLDKSRYNWKEWHKKRVGLKRYHHTLDIIAGSGLIEIQDEDLKIIRTAEQLMGDWHDLVITTLWLRENGIDQPQLIKMLTSQAKLLKKASGLYLNKVVNGSWSPTKIAMLNSLK